MMNPVEQKAVRKALTLGLKVGPKRFCGAHRDGWCCVLTWAAETSLRNVVWVRLVVVGPRWPPVRWATTFADTNLVDGRR